MEGILPDGASINRPPGFNGEHYSFWKAKFKVFVMATEYGLWRVFERGDYVPTSIEDGVRIPKLEEEYDDNDRRNITLNSKAVLLLQSALSQQEYFRICTLPSAKDMWDALEIAHEGTAGVKQNRVNTLMTEYDLLRMKPGESIGEFQLRFTHLINQLAALGKEYDQPVQVRKILNILNKEWEAKVTAIEEARGESMMSVAALFGSLSEYEAKLKFKKGLDEVHAKNKGVALKSTKESRESDSEEDEDEAIAMMVRRFKKFYKKDQGFKKFQKGSSSYESKKPVICYECEKPGHIKAECPQLNNKDKEKKKFSKYKKKAYVSSIWGNDSSDEDEDDDEEEKANICLVAQEQQESDEVDDSQPSYNELFAEYNLVQFEFEKLAEKYLALKKKKDRKSTRLNSSHSGESRMPSSA